MIQPFVGTPTREHICSGDPINRYGLCRNWLARLHRKASGIYQLRLPPSHIACQPKDEIQRAIHASHQSRYGPQMKDWNFDFIFTPLDENRWIAADPHRGFAFKINRSTKLMLQSIAGRSTEDAFQAYRSRTPTKLTLETFSLEIDALFDSITKKAKSPRKELTASFLILRHRVFSGIADQFTFLIKSWILALNGFFLLVLWTALPSNLTQSSDSNLFLTIFFPALIFLSVLFHELGHGAALRAHGHSTGNLGIGIYLIYPVCFIEIFTLEALASKGKFWVNVSGVHFQVIYGNIIAVLAIAAHSAVLAQTAGLVYVLAIFQLAPINKSDGYWIIQDVIRASKKPRLTANLNFATKIFNTTLLVLVLYYAFDKVFLPLYTNIAVAHGAAALVAAIATPAGLTAGCQIIVIFLLIARSLRGRSISKKGLVAVPKTANQ